jgi:hypothetical protein
MGEGLGLVSIIYSWAQTWYLNGGEFDADFVCYILH